MAIDVADWLQLTQLAAPGALGIISMPASTATVSAAFTPSPFATALVVVPTNSGTLQWASCKIVGGSSLAKYVAAALAVANLPPPPVVAAVPGTSDSPYTITITTSLTTPSIVPIATVYQLFGTGVQFVQTPTGQPLPVYIVPANNVNPLPTPLLVASGAIAPAVSSSTTLIAAVGGAIITIYGYDIEAGPQTVATVGLYQATFEDTSAAVVFHTTTIRWVTAAGEAMQARALTIPQGLPLPVFTGVKVVTGANAGAMQISYSIFYTLTTQI